MLMYYGQQLEKCQAMEEVNGADSDEVGGNIEIWASCGTDHLPNDHFSGHYYFPFIRHMISLNAPQMVVRFPNCHVASGLGNLTTSSSKWVEEPDYSIGGFNQSTKDWLKRLGSI